MAATSRNSPQLAGRSSCSPLLSLSLCSLTLSPSQTMIVWTISSGFFCGGGGGDDDGSSSTRAAEAAADAARPSHRAAR